MGPRRRHRADQGAIPGINQPIPQNPVVLQDVSNAIELDMCIIFYFIHYLWNKVMLITKLIDLLNNW